jgi:hypothetical protein
VLNLRYSNPFRVQVGANFGHMVKPSKVSVSKVSVSKVSVSKVSVSKVSVSKVSVLE